MSSHTMIYRDFSLRPQDDIDYSEDVPDPQAVDLLMRQQETSTLDTDDLMLLVCERLSTSEVLRALIEDVKAKPFVPGERRHLHISENIRWGDATAEALADVMDELIELRQSGRARR